MFRRSIAFAVLAPLFWAGSVVDAQETRLPGALAAWPHIGLNRFEVTAGEEQTDLGSWSKVDGLDVTLDVIGYRPSGGTLTFHRRAGSDSLLVKDWLAQLAFGGPTSLTIRMLDYDGSPVAQWTFTGGYPVKWQIGFDGEGSGVAIETLVFAYESLVLHR